MSRQHIAYLLTGMMYKRSRVLSFSCNFYYLVASTACFVQMMTIQVIAEREQKIQTEVKEIKKAFFCNLCNKQYKLAVEFEAHLSSYDHNHRKRFKEMREMRAGSSRDDRQKKEQLRQEKEVAKFAAQMADARRRQYEQLHEQSEVSTDASKGGNASLVNDQRQTLKFGFTSKLGSTKNSTATTSKKPKLPVKATSVFGNDSDDES